MILAQVKDDQSSRLFTVLSDQVKGYQYSKTMPEEHRDGNPKVSNYVASFDLLVISPYTVRGGPKEFYRKNDENKSESKLYFLVPDDFDWLKFAKTLKKLQRI